MNVELLPPPCSICNNNAISSTLASSSVISAAMSSLKGKKHGGANLMVMNMMDDIKSHVNVELLPPPCSICNNNAISSTLASSSVNFVSGLNRRRKLHHI